MLTPCTLPWRDHQPCSYVVTETDSCSGIIATYGLAYSTLLRLNPTINPACTNLVAGQVRRVRG